MFFSCLYSRLKISCRYMDSGVYKYPSIFRHSSPGSFYGKWVLTDLIALFIIGSCSGLWDWGTYITHNASAMASGNSSAFCKYDVSVQTKYKFTRLLLRPWYNYVASNLFIFQGIVRVIYPSPCRTVKCRLRPCKDPPAFAFMLNVM